MILHLVSHRESHIKEAFSSISITRTKGSLPGILLEFLPQYGKGDLKTFRGLNRML